MEMWQEFISILQVFFQKMQSEPMWFYLIFASMNVSWLLDGAIGVVFTKFFWPINRVRFAWLKGLKANYTSDEFEKAIVAIGTIMICCLLPVMTNVVVHKNQNASLLGFLLYITIFGLWDLLFGWIGLVPHAVKLKTELIERRELRQNEQRRNAEE